MINFIDNKLGPILYPLSNKVGESKTVRAISEGFMRVTTLTLGVALFAILGNLPIPAYSEFLKSSGLDSNIQAMLNATMNILSLYLSFTIAYVYAKQCKEDALTAGLLSTVSLLGLMVQTVEGKEGEIAAYTVENLGADSVFAALIIGLVTSRVYVYLKKKNIILRMPESVPPAVTNSLNPVFIAIIMFIGVFLLRLGFSYTAYGNAITFISTVIGEPLMKIGLSVPSVICIAVLGNFVWFFGIHANVVQAPLVPLLMTSIIANMTAFQDGKPLPYLEVTVVYSCLSLGGGLKFALNWVMLRAKSERYKSLNKVGFIPAIFNINEPTLFGFPIILNPFMFIPLLVSPIVVGIFSYVMISLFPININPSMMLLPWTTPFFVKSFFGGGLMLIMLEVTCLILSIVIYYPFFVMADRKALKDEKDSK